MFKRGTANATDTPTYLKKERIFLFWWHMKKIALIGNFLHNYADKNQLQITWYIPLFTMTSGSSLVDFYSALEASDIIFGQYHADRWADLSTDNLRQYFDINLVPTLESPCSSPQINYLDEPNKFNIYDIDFRFLELYLTGKSHQQAVEEYHNKSLNYNKILDQTNSKIKKYKKNYDNGNVISDYSDFYQAELMSKGTEVFFTHNHPNNRHLEWLMDQITMFSSIQKFISFENIPPILVDTIAPSLGTNNFRYTLKSKEIGLNLAAKILYAVFDTYEKSSLKKQFEKSNYAEVSA